jgi:acetyl esterase/lipase
VNPAYGFTQDAAPLTAIFMTMLLTHLLVLLALLSSEARDRPVLDLWPTGLPSGSQPVPPDRAKALQAQSDSEHIRYVDQPTLTLYRAPADKATGRAVVVCPGGGYNVLAWTKEGVEIAEWFNSIGVTAAVLKYRVPRRDAARIHIEPLQDAQRALRLLRHHAADWGIEANKIGILGFSAGGHLAVMAGTHWDKPAYLAQDAIDALSCRPDFMCPIYAAYLDDGYKDDAARLGELVRVSEETPPTFMAVTTDDRMRGAQAALLFVELRKHNVPAELHVYAEGGHGYGIRPSDLPVCSWHLRLGDWLGRLD